MMPWGSVFKRTDEHWTQLRKTSEGGSVLNNRGQGEESMNHQQLMDEVFELALQNDMNYLG